jgi:FSR family fosmidomycin resistance protein-like MFS transporter
MSSSQEAAAPPRPCVGAGRGLSPFVLTLLAVEFLDELASGFGEAAWPLIRDDLRLSYVQVGVILSVPPLVGHFVEPALGVLGDVWRRRALVLAGGVGFAAGTLLAGLSTGFAMLLAASILSNPSAGAFVGLSQATLMDAAPERREQNMARWALAGSVGNSVGPAAIGAFVWAGVSWRWGFVVSGVLMLLAVAAAWSQPFEAPAASGPGRTRAAVFEGLREALRALRRGRVVRWLLLLQLGDFTYDILRGFLALYFVDVVGAGGGGAALAVAVWTWVGLAGDFALVPLLERVRGLKYLRVSTTFVLLLFPSMLLAEGFPAKLALLGLLGFANAGWYAIIKSKLYDELPGQSGAAAMTLGNVFGLAGSLVPLALGAYAEAYGLGPMMWLLALGPAALLTGLLTVKERVKDEGGAG